NIIRKEKETELTNLLSKEMERLPGRQREILYLRYIREMSYQDIAGTMNISVATSRTLVYRAVRQLRKSATLPILLRLFQELSASAFFTAGTTSLAYNSIERIMASWPGSPTSICATKRVRPNSLLTLTILSATSLRLHMKRAPWELIPASNCERVYGGQPRDRPTRSI